MDEDQVYILKLINGEFCIGKMVAETADDLVMRDMRSLIAHPQGVQIAPFMFGNPKYLPIQRAHILTLTTEIEKGLFDFYRQQVSGIVVAGSGPLKLVQ